MKRKISIKKCFIIASATFIIGLLFAYSYRFIKYYLEENSTAEEQETNSKTFTDLLEATINVSNADGGLYINKDEYIYKNNATENYVWYSGHLWRIIKVNKDKTIDLIMNDSLSLINPSYENNEYLTKYLNDFYQTLDPEYLVKTEYCADKLNDLSNLICGSTEESDISLLDLHTYNITGGTKSFINNNSMFWLINQTTEGQYWFINSQGELGINRDNLAFNVRPTIRLKSSLSLVKGTGKLDDPYILKESTNNTISKALIGEYVSFNNNVWRIQSISDDAVTLISEICLKENDECLTKKFGSNNKYLNSSIYKYLNNTYYNTIENKDFIVSGNFYNGLYTNYDYQKTLDESVQAYVGLPKVGDYFISNKINSFLITPNTIDTIYTISETGNYYLILPSAEKEIYPVVNIDKALKITVGTGTNSNPYEISW